MGGGGALRALVALPLSLRCCHLLPGCPAPRQEHGALQANQGAASVHVPDTQLIALVNRKAGTCSEAATGFPARNPVTASENGAWPPEELEEMVAAAAGVGKAN